MKEYSQKDYYDAARALVNAISRRHGNKIKAIYAGGSFARGDFVPGRSDIDIYVAVEDGKEELQRDIQNEALKMEKEYLSDLKPIFGEVLGVSVTTLREIQEGKSFLGAGFEYHNFIKEGKLLWGEDIKALIPIPPPERQKESAKNYLYEVYGMVLNQERRFKWLKWIPFKLVPKNNKECWTRQAFNLTFRTAALFLGSKGIFVSKKQDVTSEFTRFVKEEDLYDIITSTLLLWERWRTKPLKDKETKQLLQDSMRFVKKLQSLR